MKNKIMLVAGATIITVGLSSAFAINIDKQNKLINYSDLVKVATQDLNQKETTQSYYKLFSESKLYNTLIKDFKIVKGLSIEETENYVNFSMRVKSNKVLKNEGDLFKEDLNNLFDRINNIDNDKNLRFEISIDYKIDENNLEKTTSDTYRLCKNKFRDDSLAIIKTRCIDSMYHSDNTAYNYNVKKQSFEKIHKKVVNEIEESFYTQDVSSTQYHYKSKKRTYFDNDSQKSSFELSLDRKYEKINPQTLIDIVAPELSLDDNFESIIITIGNKDAKDLKKYNATLDKTGKVTYDFK